MTTVNMLEAKTRLSQLVSAVESGAEDEIIISTTANRRQGWCHWHKAKKGMRLGLLEGQFPPMSLEDFNSLDEEVAKLFGLKDE
ncbi:prevent-host-death protein [Rhizobium sp. RCAM05350]|nr:prevent-host-death protein [Rhizobium sp. RCAM05350]